MLWERFPGQSAEYEDSDMKETTMQGGRYLLSNDELHIESGALLMTVTDALRVESVQTDLCGRAEPMYELTVTRKDSCCERYRFWPGESFVWMPDFSGGALWQLTGEHWILHTVSLYTYTDIRDTLSEEREVHMFARGIPEQTGQLFCLENPEDGTALVIISETADYQPSHLSVKRGTVLLENGGNAVAVGVCRASKWQEMLRRFFRLSCKRDKLIAMSNTWGDLNYWKRVCASFIEREIDAAARMGVDIVQIDDGWQTGQTADPAIFDEQRRRRFDGDFWKLDSEKFPKGLAPLSEYASSRGVKLGLWFAPDSHEVFAHLERDKAILRRAYEEWGIRYFKLDMFWVHTDADRDCMLDLVETIAGFGEDTAVELDITNGSRLGYLLARRFGTVFVENRYTGSGNAFPHRVLRNLWMLSHYLPAASFQFELVNPTLNLEKYAPEDPFAPVTYDMDYLFAAVMLSNPLYWMELQFLPDEKREALARIMAVWQPLREKLADADVEPIGEKPSGRSFTGFWIRCKDGTSYLLAFREVTAKDACTMVLPCDGAAAGELLISNTDTDCRIENGTAYITFGKARAYGLWRVEPRSI